MKVGQNWEILKVEFNIYFWTSRIIFDISKNSH